MSPSPPGIPITSETAADVAVAARALAAFFDPAEVKFKAQTVRQNKALAVAYIDARLVFDRLDDAVGVGGWQDEYELLPDGSVTCRLRVKLGGEWVTKMDVGSPSEQPDGGDRLKAAFSDAMKRAAVKFGIGRYLYALPKMWVDYDPQKRQFAARPTLPAWAVPKGGKPQPQPQPLRPASGAAKNPPPADGKELSRRVKARDDALTGAGRIPRGALVAAVLRAGQAKGCPAVLSEWVPAQFEIAIEAGRQFEAGLKPAA